MLHAKNNSKSIKDELRKLKKENKPLLMLLVDLYHYVEDNFHKDLYVTMIYRSQEQQDDIYKGYERSDGRKYDESPWKSPHQFWHAVDLRSSNLNDAEIKDIEEYLNDKYEDKNYYKWTAKNHTVGLGEHFHIQMVLQS